MCFSSGLGSRHICWGCGAIDPSLVHSSRDLDRSCVRALSSSSRCVTAYTEHAHTHTCCSVCEIVFLAIVPGCLVPACGLLSLSIVYVNIHRIDDLYIIKCNTPGGYMAYKPNRENTNKVAFGNEKFVFFVPHLEVFITMCFKSDEKYLIFYIG